MLKKSSAERGVERALESRLSRQLRSHINHAAECCRLMPHAACRMPRVLLCRTRLRLRPGLRLTPDPVPEPEPLIAVYISHLIVLSFILHGRRGRRHAHDAAYRERGRERKRVPANPLIPSRRQSYPYCDLSFRALIARSCENV